MNYEFRLSAAARRAAFLETGVMPAAAQSAPLDFTTLTPEARDAVLTLCDQDLSRRSITLATFAADADNGLYSLLSTVLVELDAAPTSAELTDLLLASATSYAAAMPEVKRLRDAHAAAAKERSEKQEREGRAWREREREREEREAAARSARELAKSEWIKTSGSERLRRAFAAEYDCQRLYVTERAAAEFPGFTVDFDDNADWKERSCPTATAMDKIDQLPAGCGARVVWLTSPAETDRERRQRKEEESEVNDLYGAGEAWQEREAIIIRAYLGKYDLVQTV